MSVCMKTLAGIFFGTTHLLSRSLLAEKPLYASDASPSNSQGQKFNAAIVRVISRVFEKVLVAQYHCQGFRIVMHSFAINQYKRIRD